jgi:hypothetical protein
MNKNFKVISTFLILSCFLLVLSGCADSTENKAEKASPGPANTEKIAETSAQQADTQDSASSDSKSIPKDYPKEFCPIYEPSTIIHTEQINVEDKTNYIIEFVSQDEMNTIEAFYLELDHVTDTLSMGDVMSQITLNNKSEKHSGIINLEPVDRTDFASYESEGYKMYAKIMVDIGW